MKIEVKCACGHAIRFEGERCVHEIEGQSLDGPACAACGCRKARPATCATCYRELHKCVKTGQALEMQPGLWICWDCQRMISEHYGARP